MAVSLCFARYENNTKKTITDVEQNSVKAENYQQQLKQLDDHQAVYVDETDLNIYLYIGIAKAKRGEVVKELIQRKEISAHLASCCKK